MTSIQGIFLILALANPCGGKPDTAADTADNTVDTADCVDADGDGYVPCVGIDIETDCNDHDASIHPGAKEVCDGVDNDCDPTNNDSKTWYLDADGDGYGDPDFSVESCTPPPRLEPDHQKMIRDGTDCDDHDAAINPDATEICGDEVDNNCNGRVDERCK